MLYSILSTLLAFTFAAAPADLSGASAGNTTGGSDNAPDSDPAGTEQTQERPERAIMFIIDGLHYEAPDRLEMPNFNRLASQGTLIEKTTVIMPGHPTHGDYARVHSSSFPNPMMMTGTAFLTEDQTMLQHRFDSPAFVANTFAYRSISHDYDFAVQRSDRDAFSVETALDLLENHEIDFMRIHLQNPGSAGSRVLGADEGTPYRHNIWHEESPFVETAEEADRLLGHFVDELQRMGLWDSTLLVVTSDHGQTETGWHPLIPEESWFHPTVFVGPGVGQGREFEWADQIDLAPTITDLMGVEAPGDDGGAGVALEGVRADMASPQQPISRLLELNRVFARHMLAESELILESVERPYLNSFTMRMERGFYSLDRIMQWHRFDSLEELIDHNLEIVERMEERLE